MDQIPFWAFFLYGIADQIICYLIFFYIIHWNIRNHPWAFGMQVVLIGLLEASWNAFSPLDPNRLWITVLIQVGIGWLFIPNHRLRVPVAVLFLKSIEILYLILVAIIRNEHVASIQEIKFTTEEMLFFLGLLLIIKSIVLLVLYRVKRRFYNSEIQSTDHSDERDFHSNKIVWLFGLLVISSSAFILFAWSKNLIADHQTMLSLFIMELALYSLIFVWIQRVEQKKRILLQEEQLKLQEAQLMQVNELFAALRSERHDFVNHVQVLNGLFQHRSYDQAEKYVQQLVSDVRLLNQVILKDQPLLSAILQVKMAQCLREGIELQIEIRATLVHVPWKSTEMMILIGNVLTNAIEALQNEDMNGDGFISKVMGKRIWIRTEKDADQQIRLTIGNNGKLIPSEYMQRLTEHGFTDKSNHSGVGLASVYGIIMRIGGSMTITSDAMDGTLFEFVLPTISHHDRESN